VWMKREGGGKLGMRGGLVACEFGRVAGEAGHTGATGGMGGKGGKMESWVLFREGLLGETPEAPEVGRSGACGRGE